ncbi:ABC transporter ATP-binding protein [Iocasia frigidifontis]|uniref:ABC transporter ATP-binding protein n=1 Tax=Iocasia fonsfrigidae TaxID=2682810 RepID=UPI001E594236|nr:ABC transporter ATP-binding protein [Iocasia fonsfrigidae]
MEEIISIKDLSFKYPGASDKVLNNINLRIFQGDFIAIIGGNGGGKTTLCKTFNGLIPHYHVGDFVGEVIVAGHNTLGTSVASLAQKVAYIYQDFENQLVRSTVYDEVTFAPLNFGLRNYQERGEYALEILGLKSIQNEFIWELSGGQKHMVALAGVLALNPDIIIIDEPVAQLDPFNAQMIYENLAMLNQEHGKTIIVIEHHTEFIASYCQNVIMMDSGRVLWQKSVNKALSMVEELKESNIYPPQVTQAVCSLFKIEGQYPITIEEALPYFSQGNCLELSIKTEDDNQLKNKQTDEKPLISFKNLSHSYKTLKKKSAKALSNINLSFYKGDRVALIGNNGSGKSTLLKLITGIIKPQEGEVIVCGKNTKDTSSEQLAERVSYIYQNPEEMFINDNIRQDIEYYLQARKIPAYNKFVNQIIKTLGLTDIQNHDGRLLSGGQQRRASLAIGTGTKPSVILLDEPTASLDMLSRKEMFAMINRLEDWVNTVIVATHDMELVGEWADRVIVLNEGKVFIDTDQYGVFGDEQVLEQTNLCPPQIVKLSRRLGMKPVALSVKDFISRLGGDKLEAI